MNEEEGKKGTFGLSQRNQYIVVAVLGIGFAGLLGYRFVGGDEASAAPVESSPQGLAAKRLPLPPPGAPVPDEPVVTPPGEKLARNPFEMPPDLLRILQEHAENPGSSEDGSGTKIAEEANRLILKGIMGSPGDRIAFINNKTVKVGSKIRGFSVVEIRKGSVLLKKGEVEVELKLEVAGSNPDDESDLD